MGKAVQGGSVNFHDEPGSPKSTVNRDSRGASRVAKIAWSDIDALIAECFPPPPAIPGAFPGTPYLFCDQMEIESLHPEGVMNASGDVPTYDEAKVRLTYSTLPYDSQTDPTELITENYDFSMEAMEIGSHGMRWPDQAAGKSMETDIPLFKKIPIMDVDVMWHRVSLIPITAIRNRVGMVNSVVFRGASIETLLFVGARITYTYTSDGSQNFTVGYRFQEKRIWWGGQLYGWNHFYRPKTKAWERPIDDVGNATYYSAEFQSLLTG